MRWLVVIAMLGCGHPEPTRPQPATQPDTPAPVIEYATGGASEPATDAGVAVDAERGDAASGGKVVVTESDECGLIIDMIYFEPGSSAVKPQSKPILDATAEMFKCWYRTHEIVRWEIQGHTDAIEKDAAKLSEARATAIKQALVDRGVLASTLEPKGYGATQPLDRRGTDFARAKNRRVMFLVLEHGKP